MAAEGMSIDIEENVTATLRGVSLRADDYGAIMPALTQIGIDSVEENFAHEGRPDKWQERKVDVPGRKILTRSRKLRAATQAEVVSDTEFKLVNNSDYAAVHNFGFKGTVNVRAHKRDIEQAFGKAIRKTTVQVSAHRRKMNMPQREFLIVAEDDAAEMQATAADYILPGG